MSKCVLNIFKIFAMRATWLYVGYFGCLMLEWGRCTPNVSNFAGDSWIVDNMKGECLNTRHATGTTTRQNDMHNSTD